MATNQITFQFVKPENLVTLPVNGYWCTPSIDGRIICDLVHQKLHATQSVTHNITPEGFLGEEAGREVSAVATRQIVASVEMSPQIAFEMGTYLQQMAVSLGYNPNPATE